ncbi:protein neprosin-like [Miscanthus floridulus]|uniref:protein neprosin-like n=1 Tax=Miscanthus floridulus TaxID=154761 RepID=UPI003458AC6E
MATTMASCSSYSSSRAAAAHLVRLLLVALLLAAGWARATAAKNDTQRFRPGDELRRYRRVQALLKRLNKPALRNIQSPDGDLIDCVAAHLQPAFDHPRLRAQRPLADPPARPKVHHHSRRPSNDTTADAGVQLWAVSGEACPEGSVPIRRVTEADVLRASSVRRFGRAPASRVRRDSVSGGHEHAVGYVAGDEYYGAKASINVWAPQVSTASEFSLSQIWVIAGSFGNDLNTIEAGWQVSPQLYGDNAPRFFTYWTTDAYQTTGCYNLLCSGFIQTNSRIAMGAAISPTSAYNAGQFDISLLVWKDPNHGNWWLEFGSGELVGYWPSLLFSHLASHASMVQFGGEVVNTRASGSHTATQMGSGHFAGEGFGRASYFRNLEVVDGDNSLVPLAAGFHVTADHPNCYDIQGGVNAVWGNYFYYGGPGRNVRCT